MKRTLFCVAMLTGAVMFQLHGRADQATPAGGAAAQTPAGQQGAAQPAGRGGGGGGGNAERPTNERSSVQIDQFIGSPINSTGHLSHGGLFTRSILRNGNPNVPGPQGAVLEYRTQLATATLPPKSSTPLLTINNQFLFYVVSGQARLDDGKTYWELREGIAMLIPPDVQRRFVNSADEPLEMLMVEWPANERARKDILVRDTNLMPYCEENVHWNNISKCVFSAEDGMTGRMLIVMLMPFTMASPHPHTPGTEEFWTKITPGNAILLLGSELRDMPRTRRSSRRRTASPGTHSSTRPRHRSRSGSTSREAHRRRQAAAAPRRPRLWQLRRMPELRRRRRLRPAVAAVVVAETRTCSTAIQPQSNRRPSKARR